MKHGMNFDGNGQAAGPRQWTQSVRDLGVVGLGLADALLDDSAQAAVEEDPGAAGELAELALRIAALPHPEEAGRVAAVKARGYCLLASARRLRGDLTGAKDALRRAALHQMQPPDSPERAFYGWQLALLRHEQGRVEEAVAGLWSAAGIYGEAGEPGGEGACLATLGAVLMEEGKHERAVLPLIQAGELLDPEREPWLVAQVRLGLALCHAVLGYPVRARRDAERAWVLCRRITDPYRRAELCGLRARIAELVEPMPVERTAAASRR